MAVAAQKAWKAGNYTHPNANLEVDVYYGRHTRSRQQYLDRLKAQNKFEDYKVARMAARREQEKRNQEAYAKAVSPQVKETVWGKLKRYIAKAFSKQ